MRISILLSLIIIAVASYFGFERQQTIRTLTTELEMLEKESLELGIPTDPEASFSARGSAQRARRQMREQMIEEFVVELISLIKESQKPGMQNDPEIQKRGMKLIETMLDLSSDELKLMVSMVAGDSSLKQQEKQQLTMFAIMMLSNDNPETALTLILESQDTKLLAVHMSQHLLTQALGSLARTDPIAAAEWLKENGEDAGSSRGNLTRAVIAQTSHKDIALALDLIKDLEERATAYGSVGSTVTIERVDEFFAAIRGHEASDEEKAHAFRSLASGSFVKDPVAAMEWLNNSEMTAKEKAAFIEGMHYHQIKDHPEAWMDWIMVQPDEVKADGDSTPRDEQTQNIIRNWTRNDYVAAGEWVQGLPEGDSKNSAVLGYAETLAAHEPAAAEAWAVTLPESVEREGVLQKIHKGLLPKDPEAAAEFATRHGIEPERVEDGE